MEPRNLNSAPAPPELGAMLRYWRDLRGKSQLELSSYTGVSQRHISFIESGRSSPSRQTLMDIAQALDVPLRDRNSLLLAAGFAPIYSAAPWNAAEMQGVTRALERMLRQHEPFPAVIMDRHWNVLVTNEAAPRFFNCFIDMKKRTSPRNMFHLIFDPDGIRPVVGISEQIGGSPVEQFSGQLDTLREWLFVRLPWSRQGTSRGRSSCCVDGGCSSTRSWPCSMESRRGGSTSKCAVTASASRTTFSSNSLQRSSR